MGCCGSKEQGDSSLEGGRAVSGAVVPAAAPEPVMPPTEEQAAKRAALLKRLAALPKHLQLGVTLAGMRELLSQLPSDAVEQVNANIPLDKVTGQPRFPENDVENGYVNQFHITRREKEDTLTVCERLKAQGSPHVGEANVFEKGLREEDTFFWVCDYVIRQTNVGPDLELLGDCVSAIGHTVLLLEPWNDPQTLKRAYCIKEVYHTQVSGAQFDMVMSTEQQRALERALVSTEYGDGTFGSIERGLSRVDVRQARAAPCATSWGPEPRSSPIGRRTAAMLRTRPTAVRGGGAGEEGDAGRPRPAHAELDQRPGRSTGGAGQARRSDHPLHGSARGAGAALRHGA
eukprot:scaffold27760_cov57-Phaeocystis_antarctica.AAC.2